MAEQNGDSVTELVDLEDSRPLESQRLLDPSVTPENLKEYAFGVGCPCPTRTMTRETAIALRSLQYPMFGNPVHYSPDSLEVGEARNHIIECALEDGVEWLFFLDYDVAPPPNTLVKLLKLNVPIASGVYHSKSVPSWPLIHVEGWKYAFEEYEFGDLIKADGCGMGCCLMKMEVFKKIKPPWFKTVPGYSRNSSAVLPMMTEDIYFCQKAKKEGFEIIIDTSIQAGHVDWKHGVIYHYVLDPNGGKKGMPGWTYRNTGGAYLTETVADANHPARTWAKTKRPKKAPKGLDLGCGGTPHDGYIGVDLYAGGEDVVKGDAKDLSWYREEFGLVPRIRASHLLEHFSHREVPRIFRDWVNTLQPGGTMEIRVPDLAHHIKLFLEAEEAGEDQGPEADYWLATIYGWQVGEGQEHKTGFTEKRLRQLALSSGLVDVDVSKQVWEGNDQDVAENAELVLTGKRGK